MEFKIDTKSSYTNITPPQATLDANMTDAIRQKWYELVDAGCQNMVLDLGNCTSVSAEGLEGLLLLHEDSYANGRSFVITGLTGALIQQFKDSDAGAILNIAPKMAEAIDIINMEIIERDLFSEE